jgi:V8-like Glu-specific endopeptidase
MRLLLAALLSAALSFVPVSSTDQQHLSTHHIVMETIIDGGSCSATSVGPHTLLTAGHCIMATNRIRVDEKEYAVTGIVLDENDHALVTTTATFAAFLPITPRVMVAGEPVHFWGNPGRSRDVYRVGTFLTIMDVQHVPALIFLLPAFAGDSGSGILDADGNLVAILSMADESADVAAFPLKFSPAQLAAIK